MQVLLSPPKSKLRRRKRLNKQDWLIWVFQATTNRQGENYLTANGISLSWNCTDLSVPAIRSTEITQLPSSEA
jgi:hypothetical protein